MAFFLDYFTAWIDIIFVLTILFCIFFPGILPLWYWIGVACMMTSVGVIGSLVFSTISLEKHNKKETNKQIVGDFMVHILPVIVLFFFYRFLESRFHKNISIFKSALFPLFISIVYICTHNVESVYEISNLSSPTIIILTVSVWLSSYQIFVPKKCIRSFS